MIGRNAYQLLRRLIRHYKIDPNRGIKEWQTRINQLNDYILYEPCYALENWNKSKVKYTKIDMREILDFALPNNYSAKLFALDWNIYEKPFKKTIDNLQTIEPDIKAESAKAKSDKALAKNVYGTKGTKRDNNGKPRVPDAKKQRAKLAVSNTTVYAGARAAETLVAITAMAATLCSIRINWR